MPKLTLVLGAVLKEYGLSTLQPDVWEDTNPPVSSMADMPGGPPSAGAARARSTAAMQGQDEADALGLYRGTVLSWVLPDQRLFPYTLLT